MEQSEQARMSKDGLTETERRDFEAGRMGDDARDDSSQAWLEQLTDLVNRHAPDMDKETCTAADRVRCCMTLIDELSKWALTEAHRTSLSDDDFNAAEQGWWNQIMLALDGGSYEEGEKISPEKRDAMGIPRVTMAETIKALEAGT